MPIVKTSTYQSLTRFSNRHVNTVFSSLLRKVKVSYQRIKISTTDNDFLDLDYSKVGSNTIVLILHGLEGSSESSYVKGFVKVANNEGWDSLALNFRGCGGSPNNLISSYHSGKTDDVKLVLDRLISEGYSDIKLVGFSLGGNVLLKYLGEYDCSESRISSTVAISVPCDLKGSALQLEDLSNRLYLWRFLRTLKKKSIKKWKVHRSELINPNSIAISRNFREFDDCFTAPVHGFLNAEDYWDKSSSLSFLPDIKTPTLIINALDDPFLSSTCYPRIEAENSTYLFLETPEKGGHLGFISKDGIQGVYWHEERMIEFLKNKK